MITQNPIIGRAKKKLAGVYARTLYGMNIIQSCPKPSTNPMSPARLACQRAFKFVSGMSNQLPQQLLNYLYYAAPQGKSRRNVLSSQLMKAVVRDGEFVTFDPDLITEIGSNPAALTTPIVVTPSSTSIVLNVADLATTQSAVITQLHCILALSYELGVAYDLAPLASLAADVVTINPIPSNWVGHQLYLYPLFDVNVGTVNNPVYAFGRFDSTQGN